MPAPAGASSTAAAAATYPIARRASQEDAGSTPATGNLPKAERAILSALAQYPQGRSKRQVAVLTGYSQKGGGFGNAIGALRSKGYVEGSRGDDLKATSAGIDALGSFEPLPTGRALLDHWLHQLPKAERTILEVLYEAWPAELGKDDLAERAGYQVSGGGFGNALGKLRTLELISAAGTNPRLSDDFFQEAGT